MNEFTQIVEQICRCQHVEIVTQLTLGNVCQGVFRVRKNTGETRILKTGFDDRGKEEIRRNLVGYQKLSACGLDWFIPTILAEGNMGHARYLMLEDCGDDFYTQVRSTHQPLEMYRRLIEELPRVYQLTVRNSSEEGDALTSIARYIFENYRDYIAPAFDTDGALTHKFQKLESVTQQIYLQKICFAHWDFTPEDVFLTTNGLKYADPHENIFGIPIIDIACFAGVARDAYVLPGSEEGYPLLRSFALGDVAELLEIPTIQAEFIFRLGRLLQSMLSARFRITKDPERAHELFLMGKEILEEMVA